MAFKIIDVEDKVIGHSNDGDLFLTIEPPNHNGVDITLTIDYSNYYFDSLDELKHFGALVTDFIDRYTQWEKELNLIDEILTSFRVDLKRALENGVQSNTIITYSTRLLNLGVDQREIDKVILQVVTGIE